jgi:TonB family protein
VPAVAADSLEKHLRKNYEKNVVALRAGFDGDKVHFDQSGNIIGTATPRPWLNGGVFYVRKVQIKNGVLELAGNRVAFMDRTEKPVVLSQPFSVEIDLGPAVTYDAVAKVIATIFESDMTARLAGYWKENTKAEQAEKGTKGTIEGDCTVYAVMPKKVVTPPKPLYSPDPEYDEGLRKKKIQGKVTYQVILNEEGIPEVFARAISIPVFDEKALDAIARWRFTPATIDGKPVCVAINIEVNFHLY